MTTTRRCWAAVLGAAMLSLPIASCSGDAGPHDVAYTFHQDDSGIKVDTPELRALKSAAGIEPCPGPASNGSAPEAGLPDLTLPCLGGGRAVDLAALRGPLLLNFWAQNCGPCRHESPLFENLSRSAKGKVAVLGVDFIDPIPGKALDFAKELGLTYPQIADPMGAAKGPLRIAALPYTFFIDEAGTITHVETGAVTSQSELSSLVHDYLGVTVASVAGP